MHQAQSYTHTNVGLSNGRQTFEAGCRNRAEYVLKNNL